MATSITWPPIGGSSFSIPAAGEVGWPSLSNFLIALQNSQGTESQKIAIRTATTTPVTVTSATDCVLRVELSAPGPSSVILPAGVNGQYFVIVDGLGDASTNNITITANGAETINGQASLVIDQDYGAYALCFRSSNWTIVGAFGAAGGAGSVPRSDIAAGQPDYVVINNNLGELSEEQYLSQSRGGMGANVSGFTGVVKAAAGTFSASTITDADIAASAGIDATKIGAGNVDNTEFGYLNGATSNIQNQINSISGAGITSLTGDVTATGPGAAAATIANGAVTDAKVASGIDASKIGAGSVDNTEFGYLNGVTSLIQTQLDGKQPLDADLTAIAGLSSTGLIARTGAGTASTRTITGTTNLITVTDGDGVSGNPTINVGSSVVTLTGTQALTNKDYDGGTASNTSRLTIPKDTYANLVALTRKEGTLVYATDQDTVYADDGTNLIPVGSGSSGTGTLNIVDNPSAVSSTTGWTAATNYTVTRDTSNSPLAGVIDTCFAISTTTASSETSTSGVYAASLAMPAALRNTKTQVSIYANIPATSLGVWRLSIYNASGTRMSLSSDSSSVTTLPAGFNGQFVATFDADSSATYTISFTQTTRTSANTLYVTNISIGNGITAQGAAVSDPVAVTFTGSWLTNTTYTAFETRLGSLAKYDIRISVTGAPTSAALTLTMPTGRTINTAAMANSANSVANILPNCSLAVLDSGTTAYVGLVSYQSSTVLTLHYMDDAAAGVSYAAITQAAPMTFANGDTITLSFIVPIAEWAGNGTVNLGQGAQVEYSSDDGSTDVFGPNGSLVPNVAFSTGQTNRNFSFNYPQQAIQDLEVQINYQGLGWSSATDLWPFSSGNNSTAANSYGIRGFWTSSTNFRVVFGNRGTEVSASNVDNGVTSWATEFAAGTRFRVAKANPSAPVGFGLVTAEAAGLLRGYSSMSKIRLHTGNGYGSTNTVIRRFNTAVVNTGVGITFADSATLGSTFTCTEAGVYAFSYSDCFNAAAVFGLSLNSSQLTTAIASITAADRIVDATTPAADAPANVSVTLSLSVGDVVRPHTSGTPESAVPARVNFTVQRIA